MTFLKTILILLLIYYGFKLFFRFFGPVLLSYLGKKAGENFQRYFEQRQNYQQPNGHKSGETTIERIPKNRPSDTTTGEYVDFEEIDD